MQLSCCCHCAGGKDCCIELFSFAKSYHIAGFRLVSAACVALVFSSHAFVDHVLLLAASLSLNILIVLGAWQGFALGNKDAIAALESIKAPIDFNQYIGE